MDRNDKLIYQVNKIVQVNLDRMRGYEKAYTLVESKQLRELFEQCIGQSDTYAAKLRSTMIFHGVKMDCRPSVLGLGFRSWMQFKTRLSKNRDLSVLRSCLDAENMVAINYRLICDNKFLHYYYPLLRYTFLKQQFSLKITRENMEAAINIEKSGTLHAVNMKIAPEPDSIFAGNRIA